MEYLGRTGQNKDIVNKDYLEEYLDTNVFDDDGKVKSQLLPSYVDDVLEYANKASFPASGESGKIYVDLSTNLTYRWGGSAYVEISPSLALGETSSTAYAGNKGKANADNITALQGRMSSAEGNFAKYLPLTGGSISGNLSVGGTTTLAAFTATSGKIGGNDIFHKGNANLTSVAWSCSSLTMNGALSGATTGSFSGSLDVTGEIRWGGTNTGSASAMLSSVSGATYETSYASIQARFYGVSFNCPLVLQNQGGNVGINTTNPFEKFTLNGGTGDGATYDAVLALTRTSSTGNVETAKIVLDDQDTNWGNLVFRMKTTASSGESASYYKDAMVIDGKTGNVTINGTLHCTGGIYSDSYVSAGGQNSSAPSGNANVQPITGITPTTNALSVTKTNPIGTENVIVVVYDSNNKQVLADVTVSASTITFSFTTTGTYHAIVIGSQS